MMCVFLVGEGCFVPTWLVDDALLRQWLRQGKVSGSEHCSQNSIKTSKSKPRSGDMIIASVITTPYQNSEGVI